MTVITISSLKGGVGKTTTSIHLAHGLARAGYQTLLVDCDLSCHCSRFFGVDESSSKDLGVGCLLKPLHSLGAICNEQSLSISGIPRSALRFNVRDHLDLLPGLFSQRYCFEQLDHAQNELGGYLADAFRLLSSCYQFIVVDTGPQLNFLTSSALHAASLLIIPVDGALMSVDSLEDLLRFSFKTCPAQLRCVLKTMVNRSAKRTSALSLDALTSRIDLVCRTRDSKTGYRMETGCGLLETSIKRAEIVNQLTYLKRSAFDIAAAHHVAENFSELIRELLYIISLQQREPTYLPSSIPATTQKFAQ